MRKPLRTRLRIGCRRGKGVSKPVWAKIRAVWARELLDTVRDKRTLYMMVLLPIVLMPLMMAIGPLMAVRQVMQAEETVPAIALVGGEHVGDLSASLEASGRLVVKTVSSSLDAAARDALEQRLMDESLDLV